MELAKANIEIFLQQIESFIKCSSFVFPVQYQTISKKFCFRDNFDVNTLLLNNLSFCFTLI